MKVRSLLVLNVILTLCGVLFSGYMSAVKFFTSNCIASEPCPLFLGYPACYFGFGLFSTLFLVSVLALFRVLPFTVMRWSIRAISLSGALFAGNFVFQEVQRIWVNGFQPGTFGLPTCAYGLFFFLTIFAVSFTRSSDNSHVTRPQFGLDARGASRLERQ